MPEREVGKCTRYYPQVGVAIVELSGILELGDLIHIKGAATNFTQSVDYIQVGHDNVTRANIGESVAMKMVKEILPEDKIYKLMVQ